MTEEIDPYGTFRKVNPVKPQNIQAETNACSP